MNAAQITCSSCRRRNRSHRGYCGGCGASLQPVCRGCHFVNEATDTFCGGCGNTLVVHATAAATATPAPNRVSPPRPPTKLPPLSSRAARVDTELNALFTPGSAESPDDQLPAANITQADLDRLFGGST